MSHGAFLDAEHVTTMIKITNSANDKKKIKPVVDFTDGWFSGSLRNSFNKRKIKVER